MAALYLIDPFHLSRIPALKLPQTRRPRAVGSAGSAEYSLDRILQPEAVHRLETPIDFLLIDGDHREEAVKRDWLDWSRFVKDDGVVAFQMQAFSFRLAHSRLWAVRFIDTRSAKVQITPHGPSLRK